MIKKTTLPAQPALIMLLLSLVIAAPAAAGEARIAISVFQINAGEDLGYLQAGLSSLLPPRISLPGKICVVDNSDVRRALSPPRADYSHEKKAQLAGILKVDYLLTGSLTKIGEGISIDAFLFDAVHPERSAPLSVSCAGLDSMIEKVQELAAQLQRRIINGPSPEPSMASVPDAGEAPPVPEPPAPMAAARRKRSPVVPQQPSAPVFESAPCREYVIIHRPFVCMAAGDLTGQGHTQLLFADHLDINVYSPTPEELVHTATVQGKTDEYIIQIDTYDLNDNGHAEIYATSYDGSHANSFIAEYADGTYRRIAEKQPWFFHPYPDDNGWVLLGVTPGTYNPFYGTAFEFMWKDKAPQPGAEYSLPGGVSPFGSSRCGITGDQDDEYIAFSRGVLGLRYSLHVLSGTGRILWKDPQGLGGEPNSFPRAIVGDGAETAEPIPLRVYCSDINGDRRADVLLPHNVKKSDGVLGRLASYSRGEMLCLHWDGTSLSQNWSSGMLDGYISDFLVADIDGDGALELLVLSVTGHSITGKARNVVRVYKQAR